MDFLLGFKTYLAAAGLLGLALYQFSQGQYQEAYMSLMGALAAFGLRTALGRTEAAAAQASTNASLAERQATSAKQQVQALASAQSLRVLNPTVPGPDPR